MSLTQTDSDPLPGKKQEKMLKKLKRVHKKHPNSGNKTFGENTDDFREATNKAQSW